MWTFFALTTWALAAPLTSISGEIVLLEVSTAPIHLYLVDEEAFRTPLHGVQVATVIPDAADVARGRVAFRFTDVPPGRYGVRCFQDLDGDGALARGAFGPKEPWGMSWGETRSPMWPRFEDVAFDIGQDEPVDLLIHLE